MNTRLARTSALVVSVALATSLTAGEKPVAEPTAAEGTKTLDRVVDWVLLKGKDVPRLQGRHKNLIRAMSFREGELASIPYQIDEMKDGGYCWEKGENVIEDDDKGIFDADDELCFLARDAGDKADPKIFPTSCDGWHEVELQDPLTGKKGWVYLMKFKGTAPPMSWIKYVRIQMEEGGVVRWYGDRFRTTNDKTPENACRATTLSFAPVGSEDPGRGMSIIDCSKVSMDAHWTLFTVSKNSADCRIAIGGYNAGAIRILAQNLLEVKLALGIWISAPDSLLVLWPNCTAMPTNVKLPVTLNDSGGSNYKLPIDLSSRAKGWKFYNEYNYQPVDIDGKMDEREQKLDMRFPSWNCAFGPEGALITRFVLDPRCVKPTNRLLYVDDASQNIEPEFEPGAFGTFGYYVDLDGMKSGLYSGDYYIFYGPAPFQHGDEKKYLNVLDNPLKKNVR